MSAQLVFSDETAVDEQGHGEPWKVLIIDDEPEVHAVTKLALSDFRFLGRSLEFHSAYSGKEAMQLVREHRDAAIILLDVVMETDDAGLKVAKYIREDLGNQFPRIVLRTGQPGQAPERTVVVNYDINDYKSKTELTAQKLFTSVMASLRSYRDIIRIEQQRKMLEQALKSVRTLLEQPTATKLAEALKATLAELCGCQVSVSLARFQDNGLETPDWLTTEPGVTNLVDHQTELLRGELVIHNDVLMLAHKNSLVVVTMEKLPEVRADADLYKELLQTAAQVLKQL